MLTIYIEVKQQRHIVKYCCNKMKHRYVRFSLIPTLIILIANLCVGFCSENDHRPVVNTSLGSVRGIIEKSDNGKSFYAYRSIPYAKSPVKRLRFRDPEAIDEKWDGVLEAAEDGPQCIQFDITTATFLGDEDCLHLNVYTPVEMSKDLLPVMVFIHGGGFIFGSSVLYQPYRFMDKEVILVVFNYRLGVLGYLTTEDENSPGNYGLLDQTLALHWVQKHIANFGGDPNRVTIFGESAGSASVMFHLVSPLSKGLFHAAIIQSGSFLSNWARPRSGDMGLGNAVDIASKVKCPTDNNRLMVECLRRKPALDLIVEASKQTRTLDDGSFLYGPTIDVSSRGHGAFLPDQPSKLLKDKKFTTVPIMSGALPDEGLIFLYWYNYLFPRLEKMDVEDLQKLLVTYANPLFRNGQNRETLKQVHSHYFQKNKDLDATIIFSNAVGDDAIVYKIDQSNEYLAKHNVPLYVYKFTYRGTHSVVDNYGGFHPTMVTHLDELQYLLNCAYFKSDKLSDADRKMSEIMLTLWTNFARNKVPDLSGSSLYDPSFKWEPMTSGNHKYLNLSLTPTMNDGHLCDEYDFWNNIRNSLNAKDEL